MMTGTKKISKKEMQLGVYHEIRKMMAGLLYSSNVLPESVTLACHGATDESQWNTIIGYQFSCRSIPGKKSLYWHAMQHVVESRVLLDRQIFETTVFPNEVVEMTTKPNDKFFWNQQHMRERYKRCRTFTFHRDPEMLAMLLVNP